MEKGENGGMEQNMTQEKVMEILGKVILCRIPQIISLC